MKIINKIYEFFFERWKIEVSEIKEETWSRRLYNLQRILSDPETNEYKTGFTQFKRTFVIYTYRNKFDGSIKIKKVYLS